MEGGQGGSDAGCAAVRKTTGHTVPGGGARTPPACPQGVRRAPRGREGRAPGLMGVRGLQDLGGAFFYSLFVYLFLLKNNSN